MRVEWFKGRLKRFQTTFSLHPVTKPCMLRVRVGVKQISTVKQILMFACCLISLFS
ncbi:hypothetical protein NEIMUCOT_05109 [Neisseria mucosa ATCC 25996]|uniref:Uncharacterized protein n=1 Tax=Neisseria mucosa (strain ATCC 25996 / DSM 4631 / NCTC 10774 / M26) TaxID=546266 RepID=D2ZWW1_NEIM2|nr:hypothetical protein NEIMUCOT_05109 [Neisseria mucosa ATCC 25996]